MIELDDKAKVSRLLKNIQEGVNLKLQSDSIAEAIKDLRTVVKDDIGISIKEFNQLVDAEYDNAKVITKIEELSESLASLTKLKVMV